MARTVTAKEFRDVGASPSRAQNLADKINTLDASIRDRYTATVKDFYSEYGDKGYELEINQAARTPEEQRAIKATGVKAASPKNTWHTVGGAADFTVFKNGKADKGTTYKNAYEELLRPVAAKHGLANPIRNDVGHFMPEEFPLARRGSDIAQFIQAAPDPQGVLMADANIPLPQNRPDLGGLLAFNAAAPGTLASSLAAAPFQNVDVAPLNKLPTPLDSAPVSPVERGGSLLAPGMPAPVGRVDSASLPPVTQFPSLEPAPVGGVSRAPLQNLPQTASSAPVGGVERGLLANLPASLPGAPVGAVEQGGMLRPASYGGDPSLMNAGQFAAMGQTADGRDVLRAMPTTGGQVAASGDPLSQFEFTPGMSPVEPASAEPFGNQERPTLELYGAESRPVPMVAQAGSVVDQITAAPVSPVERGILADAAQPQNPMALADYAQMASMPSYAGMDAMGVDAMTTAANANMANKPAVGPEVPLGITPIPVPGQRPLAPLAQPKPVKQYNVASPAPYAATPAYAPPPSSGMDVWQGRASSGMATDGSTLSRNADGTVSRYSDKYDRWDTFNPQSGSWTPGGGTGGSSGFNLPSKDRIVGAGKEMGAKAAGGLLGSALMGPVGGILGAVLANNLISGKGILGQGGNRNVFPAAPGSGLTGPFPAAPTGGNNRGGSNLSYSDMASISPAAAESIARGETVGLF